MFCLTNLQLRSVRHLGDELRRNHATLVLLVSAFVLVRRLNLVRAQLVSVPIDNRAALQGRHNCAHLHVIVRSLRTHFDIAACELQVRYDNIMLDVVHLVLPITTLLIFLLSAAEHIVLLWRGIWISQNVMLAFEISSNDLMFRFRAEVLAHRVICLVASH